MTQSQSLEVQEMLSAILQGLVDDRRAFVIDQETNETGTVFRVRVKAAEIGRIIGANGRTARALRVILNAVSAKLKTHFDLDITQDS